MEEHREYVDSRKDDSPQIRKGAGARKAAKKPSFDLEPGKGGTLVADFNFGTIEGIMILNLSKETLDAIAQNSSGSTDNSDTEDEFDSDEPKVKGKRKHITTKTTKDADTGKKRKILPSVSRRVYYQLRGSETGEGQILPEPQPGHINFLNDQATRFVSLAYEVPYISGKVEFHGVKVSDKPLRTPESWDSFSWSAYEYARAARWR
ncbi:hypothetical protein B0T10DRAFT_568209 [Thelonectria olida]|uniref:Uncharacterized protein n=1 Tax=Thelonectria olida TaxID=1576542 RepID=A0A9P9AF17_9HYPO|nr:hypothetical protein B0T10DRAFT_568209 [Thelonectria olida]